MEDITITSFNKSCKRENNYLYTYSSDYHAYGYCSCGFRGKIDVNNKCCPKCGVKPSKFKGLTPTDNISERMMIPLEVTANDTYFYLKLFEINAKLNYVKDEGVFAYSSDETYLHEIFFGYELNKKGEEKFVTRHLVNGEKIPFRKGTIENLYSYYTTYNKAKMVEYADFSNILRTISLLDYKEYSINREIEACNIWNIQYFYKHLRVLLKYNYINIYADTIEDLKQLNKFIETVDKKLFTFINESLVSPGRPAYSFKDYFRPSYNGCDTNEELYNYYKEILDFSKIYPDAGRYELNTLVKMKNKLGYTFEEMDEINRKIDNQAFKNLPGAYGDNALSLIYEAQTLFKTLDLPTEKVPKELAIYATKARALRNLLNTEWYKTLTFDDCKQCKIACLMDDKVIKELYMKNGYKALDDALIDFNMKKILIGNLKLVKKDKKIYRNIFIYMQNKVKNRYNSEYKILKLVEINENEISNELIEEEEILNRIKELFESEEVAYNE